VVEAIFVEEESARRGVVAVHILSNGDDVAAGAEPPAVGVVNEDDPHLRIVAPLVQRRGHVADHLAVEAVQRARPVEAEPPGLALLGGEDVFGGSHRIHRHGIIA